MIVWFRVWGERLFPERQLLLRTGSRVRSIALPGWFQAVGLFLCLCWIGGGAYLLHEAANSSRGLRETAAVVPSQPVTGASSATVAELQQQLAAANAQYATVAAQYADVSARLEKARSDAAAAKAENGTLRGALGLAESKTKTLEKTAKALEKNRDELQHRIQTAEQSAGATGNRTTQLAKSLEESRSALDRSEAQRTN